MSDIVRVTIESPSFEKVVFEGDPKEVFVALQDFLLKLYPALSLAKRLMTAPDLASYVEELSKVVGVTEEGPYFKVDTSPLSDRERILLCLALQKVLFMLGTCDSDVLQLAELAAILGKSSKVVSSRISEIPKNHIRRHEVRGGRVGFSLTLPGLHEFFGTEFPKIAAKLGLSR